MILGRGAISLVKPTDRHRCGFQVDTVCLLIRVIISLNNIVEMWLKSKHIDPEIRCQCLYRGDGRERRRCVC